MPSRPLGFSLSLRNSSRAFPSLRNKEGKRAGSKITKRLFLLFFCGFYSLVWFKLTACPGPLHSSTAVSAHPLCLAAAASSPPPVHSPWPGHPHMGFSLFKEHVNTPCTHTHTQKHTQLYLTTADSALLHLPPHAQEFL